MEQTFKTLLAKSKTSVTKPRYGSKEWWEKAEIEADEAIKAKRYTMYKNVEDLINDLHKK